MTTCTYQEQPELVSGTQRVHCHGCSLLEIRINSPVAIEA